jgi:predicted nucleotidyltransferase
MNMKPTVNVKKLNLQEFFEAYVTNEKRKCLFDKLLEDLQVIKSQCSCLRIIIFGSYITPKLEPNDIDLMISLIPESEYVYDFMTGGLWQKNRKEIDIQYQKAEYFLKDAHQLVVFFNENPFNKEKGICITECIELLDI